MLSHPGDLSDDDFVTLLAEALITSGLAMAVCGSSRPCSGGCHEISHAIDLTVGERALHAEQVGVGALFCTFLRGDRIWFADLNRVLARHGLPRLPADLGLTDEEFVDVVLYAPRTRPDRYTILEHLDLSAGGGPVPAGRLRRCGRARTVDFLAVNRGGGLYSEAVSQRLGAALAWPRPTGSGSRRPPCPW